MALQDNVIAIGSEHSCIFLYSTTTGTLIAKLEGHTNRYVIILYVAVIIVYSLLLSPIKFYLNFIVLPE